MKQSHRSLSCRLSSYLPTMKAQGVRLGNPNVGAAVARDGTMVSQAVLKQGPEACPVRRVPAGAIEAAVIGQVRALLREPEIVVATSRAARAHDVEHH